MNITLPMEFIFPEYRNNYNYGYIPIFSLRMKLYIFLLRTSNVRVFPIYGVMVPYKVFVLCLLFLSNDKLTQ